jgi:hypothetical protein
MSGKVRVYLDVCSLCRPFDDQLDHRIRLESEAVLAILDLCSRDWILVTSDAHTYEIRQIPDYKKMTEVLELMRLSREHLRFNAEIYRRARKLTRTGITAMDALHVASAGYGAVPMLTTDDQLVTIIKSNNISSVQVTNPIQWLLEVLRHDPDSE